MSTAKDVINFLAEKSKELHSESLVQTAHGDVRGGKTTEEESIGLLNAHRLVADEFSKVEPKVKPKVEPKVEPKPAPKKAKAKTK